MCFSVEVDKNLKKLAQRFSSQIDAKAFFDLQDQVRLNGFKIPNEDGRVFPNYFAPVIVLENGKRMIRPMRYRVRPSNSQNEIPSKYNVFNARIDSLEKRKTWQPIFMKNHGLFPFLKFFEWVKDENKKKKLINFSPDNYEIMWAPCLWDSWQSKDGKVSFKSFALLTDDPPPEIEEKGHDRCPIFLKENLIDSWLSPKNFSKEEMYNILKQIEVVHYDHAWAA